MENIFGKEFIGIKELCIVSNIIAKEHGWWDDITTDPQHNRYVLATKLALISCEVSEAIEDLRKGDSKHMGEELADIAIRLADFAEQVGIDLEFEIRRKTIINTKREYKHGKCL